MVRPNRAFEFCWCSRHRRPGRTRLGFVFSGTATSDAPRVEPRRMYRPAEVSLLAPLFRDTGCQRCCKCVVGLHSFCVLARNETPINTCKHGPNSSPNPANIKQSREAYQAFSDFKGGLPNLFVFNRFASFVLGSVWVECGLATPYQGSIPYLGLVGPFVIGPLEAV